MNEPTIRPPVTETRRTIPPALAYPLITVSTFTIAANMVLGRGVHETIPPVGLSFWRWTVATLVLFPFVWPELLEKRALIRRHLGTFALLGILMSGSGTLVYWALNLTTAINATLANAAQPTMTALLAWILVHERLNWVQVLGIMAAAAGITVMVSQADWRNLAALEFNTGDLLMLAATAGYSFYSISLRKTPPDLSVGAALVLILGLGGLALLPIYVVESIVARPVPINTTTLGTILFVAIFASALALVLWNEGLHAVGINRAVIFVNLLPVFGAGLAIPFLGERLYAYHLAGAALVCAGIFLVVRTKKGGA